ncbi:MAG: rhamnulokinase [Opitutae bacterium]|nr:rhamnulokinase [Opitutae bacterium]MBT5380802.1 rhamnulokinase [Opitutae bacterium]MBT5692002.1 rhamnulokinase [Opitutae bacterium]MBT6463426.1 rhamnulokinase [Opitutae bacterium]MBT6959416.1 rhamnulokinase [Opitutae bacterium]
MSTHYLACDFGAESGRLMLGTLNAGQLALEELHRFPNIPLEDSRHGLHWNVSQLFAEVQKGLKIAGERNLPISSISVDGWGVDYFLLDAEGEIIEPTFCYRNERNQQGVDHVFSKVPWEEVYGETGIQFIKFNTLYQLGAETPERLDKAATILPLGDGFNHLLCGVAKAEGSMASTTQMYDPRSGDWSDTLISAMGWSRNKFADIVSSGTHLGPLKPELAEASGLGGIDVIATCSHDTGAAVAAVPAVGEDWAYLSSGTWSLIGVELAKPIISDQSRELNFTNEIGYGNTVRLLRNVTGLWVVQECRREWQKLGQSYDYAALAQLATEAEPFVSLINPDDDCFFSPDNMLEAIKKFCLDTGQPVPASPGAYIRCALESLALLYRRRLFEVSELTGRTLNKLHIVGGGSKNALLNQFAANATGMEVVAGPAEATALGNIIVQAITLGHLENLEDARQVVGESMDVESYLPKDTVSWQAAYQRFSRLADS